MSSLLKLNWNELDGTVADVNDIKPIADKVDDVIDVVNPLDDEVAAARDGEASLLDKINSIDANIDSNDNELADHETRITDVETEISTARDTFTDLDSRLDGFDTRVDANTAHRETVSGNPHAVTKDEVGLGNVTNDAQLKRSANDINSFTEKTLPVNNDIVLIEDSEDSYAKKKVSMLNLPLSGVGTDLNAIHKNGNSEISSLTEKTNLAADDSFIIEDSEDSNNKKKYLYDKLNTSINFPTRAEFESLAEKNRRQYDGSGFVEWGKHFDSGGIINEGMYCHLPSRNTIDSKALCLGRDYTDSIGISKTNYPISNVNGYLLKMYYIGTDNIANRVRISFPSPPSSPDQLFRQDLVFLEVWHEKIFETTNGNDKDWFCPYGNTQYGATTFTCDDRTVINLVKITDELGSSYQGYCAFGSWDTNTIGYGIKWSNLTESQKKSIIGSKYQNIYMDGDNIIQVRYRVRVVSDVYRVAIDTNYYGQGNTVWFSVTKDPSSRLYIRGVKVDNKDYGVWNTLYNVVGTYYLFDNVGIVVNDNDKLYGNENLNFDCSYNGQVYEILIANVSRRNIGAYHPVYNPNGCAKFNNSGTAQFWYEYTDSSSWTISTFAITGVNQLDTDSDGTIDTYQFVIAGDQTDYIKENYYITVSGSTGNDGRYYVTDVTYDGTNTIITTAETIPDTTADGSLKSDYQYVKYCFDNATGGDIASAVSGRPDGLYSDEINERDVEDLRLPARTDWTIYIESGATRVLNKYVANDVRGNEPLYKIQANTLSTSITKRWHDGINLASYLEETDYISNNTLLWCDIIGDASNYPSSWLNFGITGTPLVKDEDGNSVLPDGTATTWKLSRKYSSVKLVLKNGTPLTETTDFTLGSIGNTITFVTAPATTDIIQVFYETYCNALEPVVNSRVDGDFSKIFAGNWCGNLGAVSALGVSLINKVTTASSVINIFKLNLNTFETGIIYQYPSDSNNGFIHDNIQLNTSSVAYKTFNYITEQNGLLYPVFVFKEMKYDSTSGTWGDNSKFEIRDYVGTMTDDNGQTILYGQKISKVPLGFAKNTIIDIY